jgi:hypothetical protein
MASALTGQRSLGHKHPKPSVGSEGDAVPNCRHVRLRPLASLLTIEVWRLGLVHFLDLYSSELEHLYQPISNPLQKPVEFVVGRCEFDAGPTPPLCPAAAG